MSKLFKRPAEKDKDGQDKPETMSQADVAGPEEMPDTEQVEEKLKDVTIKDKGDDPNQAQTQKPIMNEQTLTPTASKDSTAWFSGWKRGANASPAISGEKAEPDSLGEPDEGLSPNKDTLQVDPSARWSGWMPRWTPSSSSLNTSRDLELAQARAKEESENPTTSEEPRLGTSSSQAPNPVVQAVKNPAIAQHWIKYFNPNKLEQQVRKRVNVDSPEDSADDKMETMVVPKLDGSSVPKVDEIGSTKTKSPDSVKKRKTRSRSASPTLDPTPIPALESKPATPRSPSPKTNEERKANPTRSKPASDVNHLILPTWSDSFLSGPKSRLPAQGLLSKTLSAVNSYFSMVPPSTSRSGLQSINSEYGPMPRAWSVVGKPECTGVDKLKRIVIVAVHGWMPGTLLRAVLGQPTGTSAKFGRETANALSVHLKSHYGIDICQKDEEPLEKVRVQMDTILLEGDGKVDERIERFHRDLLEDEHRMKMIEDADAIIWATHSQGAIVSTGLLATLIQLGHIRPCGHRGPVPKHARKRSYEQRICMLAMCGINRGPLNYLYNQFDSFFAYVERPAARELFEFQNPSSKASLAHAEATKFILDSGVKMTLVASLQDQVVPVYSALFEGLYHSHILRAIYVDEIGYRATDFISNLVVFAVRLRNAGLQDHGLLVHLSEAVSGSLTGLGHSTVYNSSEVYLLAIRYLFDTSSPAPLPFQALVPNSMTPSLDSFDTRARVNPYLLPYALRGISADPDIRKLFAEEMQDLRDAYEDWSPQNRVMAEMKWRLEPIRLDWGSRHLPLTSRSHHEGLSRLLNVKEEIDDKTAKL